MFLDERRVVLLVPCILPYWFGFLLMLPFSIVLFCCLPPLLSASLSPPRAYSINCGSKNVETVGGTSWLPDDGFIDAGNSSYLDAPGTLPFLSSLRYFPDESARKYCYVIPVARGTKYLVRTTYYYGGFDGGKEPPVFDQIVEGTKWSAAVNTSEYYARGLAAYYEVIVVPYGKSLSVCLARNERTASSPFISALEVVQLQASMYNSTDFAGYALASVARHRFGYDGSTASYPDDRFNRYWEPFVDANPVVASRANVTSNEFWNLPPEAAFATALTTSRGKNLTLQWPALMTLPNANYYLALYFQDNRSPSPYSWRVFDVLVNGRTFYSGLNVSTAGVAVFGDSWQLSGPTQMTLVPASDSPVGPLINAGELFMLLPLGGRTHTRDVIAMQALARSFENPPTDWRGDPCLPQRNSWTGLTCSGGKIMRVSSLNLTNLGISGSLPSSIANLTAISSIWLGGNRLYGAIPDMSRLKHLVTLHLENNQLNGTIPPSLGQLPRLQELYLQENDLQGPLPDGLKQREGIIVHGALWQARGDCNTIVRQDQVFQPYVTSF